MLNIQQIEALRKTNPQLYETLKRLAGASLGPNQGWSIDDQITDGTNYARVAAGALTTGQHRPDEIGRADERLRAADVVRRVHLRLDHFEPHLDVERAHHFPRRRHHDRDPERLGRRYRARRCHDLLFLSLLGRRRVALAWVAGGSGAPANAQTAKTNLAAQQQALQGHVPLSQGAMVAATTSAAPAAARAAAAEAACAPGPWC